MPDINQLTQLSAMHGLGVVLSVLITACAGWLMIYVLKENARREERYIHVLDKTLTYLTELLVAHDARAINAITSLEQANRFQREEHQKIVDSLNRISTVMEVRGG